VNTDSAVKTNDTCIDQTPLGEPLGIAEVARLIGCSVWSVRQRLIPKGLPHFRSAPGGRLIFYREQVVRWILQKQAERRS
jgi:hypothetical protein